MASQHTISRPNTLIEIEEFDQAHNLIATYIQSPTNPGLGDDKKGSRIDVVIPENTYSYARGVLNAFLPAGYPNSVTSDYLEYQIYDSLQAFSSSIAGLLSSRAVLEGLGVGNASASPTSALLLSVLQDSMGRIATIAFAHRLGSALEPECKMYRLLADVFNDAAMVLDCLSPAFPKGVRVGVLAGSSVLRSLCGVAAGSSKASLSAHFAKEGNLGELNAKDSSQETIISLLGMLFGTLVVSHLTTKLSTWIALLFLLAVHLGTNYKAVTAVCMRSLNRQRACLVLGEVVTSVRAEAAEGLAEGEEWTQIMDRMKWPTPEWVRSRERVFERDGIVRTTAGSKHEVISWCEMGVSLRTLIAAMSPDATHLPSLLDVFKDEKFILWFDRRRDTYLIVLKEGAGSRDVVKAWFCVVVAVRVHAKSRKQRGSDEIEEHDELVERLDKARGVVGDLWEPVQRGLEGVGWDLDVAALETRSGCRVRIR